MSETAPQRNTERLPEGEPRPIIGFFTVLYTPEGGAPEHIRTGWVGLTLPVREGSEVDGPLEFVDLVTGKVVTNRDAIRVHGADAKDALIAANQQEELEFWVSRDGAPRIEETYIVFKRGYGMFESVRGT